MVRPPIDPDIGKVQREEDSDSKDGKQKTPTKKRLFTKRRK